METKQDQQEQYQLTQISQILSNLINEKAILHKNYCSLCRKQFSTSGNLRNHTMTIHDNQRPFKCPKPNCNKMYSIESRLQVHLRTHTGKKPYTCLQCSKSFNEKGNLKTHERFHSEARPFKCTQCDKTYKTNGHLKDHCEIQHKGMRKFKCSYCQKKFGRISTLKAHIRTHTGEKNFMCKIEGCTKVFAEKGNMEIHYKRHLKRMMNQPCSLPSVSSSDAIKYSYSLGVVSIGIENSCSINQQKSAKSPKEFIHEEEADEKVNGITRPNSNFTLYNIENKLEQCFIEDESNGDKCSGSMNINMNINGDFVFCEGSPKNEIEYFDSLNEFNLDLDKSFNNGFF